MSILNENQLLGAPGSSQYQIQRSLRFNSADSAYLSRTPASAGNRKTWTWSGWVKRAQIAGTNWIFSAGNIDTTQLRFTFLSTDTLTVDDYASSAYQLQLITTQLFRDPSAWYHIVLSVDTTQATAADRAKLYVNGSQITTFSTSTYYSQNYDTQVNTASLPHRLGAAASTTAGSVSASLNAYLADIHFIDGQALTPSAFGETDATTGEWIPKAYTGTYGTNGFKLNFSNNSAATATTLGADSSGNGNNWTPNNLSVTAGAGNDSLVDTPTSYGTDTGVGGEVRGNYCTLNPLVTGTSTTVSNGSLDMLTSNWNSMFGTIPYPGSGKWYYEVVLSGSADGEGLIGIYPLSGNLSSAATTYFISTGVGYAYYNANGNKYSGTTSTAYGAAWVRGDIVGCAFDVDNGTLTFYKNGVSQGTAFTGITGQYVPAVARGNAAGLSLTANFGQRPFAYTAPSGFKALCDTNLPAPTIVKPSTVMDVVTYTGTGASLTPTSSLGFSPDLVWIKGRSGATDHALYDTVRGATADLVSNSTAAETTQAQGLTAFNSNGFTVGTLAKLNTNTATYAAWCWDAGSSTVTNTAGTIQSSVRANASAGFSIVTYTGNGVNNATVGHGLGVAPTFLIGMDRTGGNWQVWGANMNGGSFDCVMNLNTTGALSTGVTTRFRAASSTTFTIGTDLDINANGNTYVAYCFAPVAGYSAFGSYTGNGSTDGTFVYCGFRPRWILAKRSSGSDNWYIFDALRPGYNVSNQYLIANGSDAEATTQSVDVLSNGFKWRTATGPNDSVSSATYIWAAFAEFPFQYARAR